MKQLYRALSVVLCLVLSLNMVCLAAPKSSAVLFSPDFSITSEAAVMVNLDKGVIVYEKNADKKMYPASLTKIVTAMVVLDHVPEEELNTTMYEAPLSVFDELYGTGASAVGLAWGEVTSVQDLLYSLLLKSACESAGILAYNVGGQSTQNFISMMNDKTKVIGCTGTHFTNPHGLFDKNQYTNAHDMAKIVLYALENYPKLVEIACTLDYQMQPTNVHGEGWAHIYHTNSMINPDSYEYYPYVKGFKTGTLDECGRNLSTLGSKDGNNYMLVTLGSPMTDEEGHTVYDHYEDHRMLYDWAFENLEYRQILSEGKEITEVPVRFGDISDFVRLVTGESYSCIWDKNYDETKSLDSRRELATDKLNDDGSITAPVKKGDELGSYTLTLNNEEICTVPLVAQQDVTLSVMDETADKAKNFFTSGYFIAAVILVIILVIAYVAIVLTAEKKRRQRIKRIRRTRKF